MAKECEGINAKVWLGRFRRYFTDRGIMLPREVRDAFPLESYGKLSRGFEADPRAAAMRYRERMAE